MCQVGTCCYTSSHHRYHHHRAPCHHVCHRLKALSPEEEDDGLDDLGGGESIVNMSYTGDFVSQTMLRQSIQQYVLSMHCIPGVVSVSVV